MAPPRCGCCWPTTAVTRTTRTAWPHIAPLLLQYTDRVTARNVAETSRTQSHSTTPDSGLLRLGLFAFVVTVVNKSSDITAHVSGHMSFFLHTNNSPAVRGIEGSEGFSSRLHRHKLQKLWNWKNTDAVRRCVPVNTVKTQEFIDVECVVRITQHYAY
jgi:hypothetical protein